MRKNRLLRSGIVLAGLCLLAPAQAGVISIVIDDLGYNQARYTEITRLPQAVSLSVLPSAPYSPDVLRDALQQGREVLLHLPMETHNQASKEPDTLTRTMGEQTLKRRLQAVLAQYQGVAGLNNHMGSRLTEDPQSMAWLMETLNDHHGLFFLDSRTTPLTVAESAAAAFQVPTTRRDVFLDNEIDAESIRRQLRKLVVMAKQQGYALAIGHPHPQTIAVLRQELPRLQRQGIELVPVGEYIHRKNAEGYLATAQRSP